MKSKLLIGLMLASSLSFGLAASVSTLAEREVLIKEAFAKSPVDAVEAINKSQQEDKIKVDDQHYVVVIKKDGDKYIRIAHFKKEKINQAVEQSIMNVMQEAEAKLSGGSGPVAFDFSAGEKKLYAVLSKQGDFLVFNICFNSGLLIADPIIFLASKSAKNLPIWFWLNVLLFNLV